MIEPEIWKPIIGYESCYLISNYGRVKSLDCFRNIKAGKRRLIQGRIRKPNLDGPKQYLKIDLSFPPQIVKTFYIHRLVAAHFVSNPNNFTIVNHKDGIKTNNLYSNLEWCSQQENIDHSWKLGTTSLANRARGMKLATKLDENKVIQIRMTYETSKTSFRKLAHQFQVGKTTIERIINNKIWQNI